MSPVQSNDFEETDKNLLKMQSDSNQQPINNI